MSKKVKMHKHFLYYSFRHACGVPPSPTVGNRPRRQRLPPAGETLSSGARLRELYKMTNNSKFAHL